MSAVPNRLHSCLPVVPSRTNDGPPYIVTPLFSISNIVSITLLVFELKWRSLPLLAIIHMVKLLNPFVVVLFHRIWFLRKMLIVLFSRRTEKNSKMLLLIGQSANCAVFFIMECWNVIFLCLRWEVGRLENTEKENSKLKERLVFPFAWFSDECTTMLLLVQWLPLYSICSYNSFLYTVFVVCVEHVTKVYTSPWSLHLH